MRITLPVLLALVVGFVLGTTVDFAPAREGPGPSNAPGKRPALTEVVSDPPGPSAATNPASEHDSKPVEPRAARTAEGLISEALARYARDELQAGWSEVRKDAMPPTYTPPAGHLTRSASAASMMGDRVNAPGMSPAPARAPSEPPSSLRSLRERLTRPHG